jgi:hypothetical protein
VALLSGTARFPGGRGDILVAPLTHARLHARVRDHRMVMLKPAGVFPWFDSFGWGSLPSDVVCIHVDVDVERWIHVHVYSIPCTYTTLQQTYSTAQQMQVRACVGIINDGSTMMESGWASSCETASGHNAVMLKM